MPSCPAATPALREVSITNTVVASVTKTQSHHRWPSLPATSSNTCQLVSSACTCPAARPWAAIASAHGAISGATCCSAPTRVPEAASNPSAASAVTIRCTGRPRTCFSYASRARNPAVNSPFGTGLAAGGAQTVLLPAFGAPPLAGIHIDDPFLGLQLRTIPPPVTRTARPLPPLLPAARPDPAIAAAVPAPAVPP